MKNRSVFSLFTLILVIFGLFAACADLSIDPPPPPPVYTVEFETNGRSPAPHSQSISCGGTVVMPYAMTKTGYVFGGWYKEETCIYN